MPSPKLKEMTVVILHRIPHHKVRYHEIINHELHDVYYVVTDSGADIPRGLRHQKIYVSCAHYIEEVIGELFKWNLQPDRVIALSEYNLIAAELIRSVFSITPEARKSQLKSVYCSRDKRLMKACAEKAGVPVARSFSISSLQDLDNIDFNYPEFVLKPICGAASENTKAYYSKNQMLNDRELLSSLNNNEAFLVEEFVKGAIYHFDGFVVDGDVKFVVGSRYIGSCLDFAHGLPLGSVQIKSVDEHIEWVVSCVEAVGINNGAFHLEGILSDRGMIFLEIGNRSGGAGVVECTEKALGINLMQEEVLLSFLGEQYELPDVHLSEQCLGWFVIPSPAFSKSPLDPNIIQEMFPEVIDIAINHTPGNASSISYSEDHNPCTGIISSSSFTRGVQVLNNIFSGLT